MFLATSQLVANAMCWAQIIAEFLQAYPATQGQHINPMFLLGFYQSVSSCLIFSFHCSNLLKYLIKKLLTLSNCKQSFLLLVSKHQLDNIECQVDFMLSFYFLLKLKCENRCFQLHSTNKTWVSCAARLLSFIIVFSNVSKSNKYLNILFTSISCYTWIIIVDMAFDFENTQHHLSSDLVTHSTRSNHTSEIFGLHIISMRFERQFNSHLFRLITISARLRILVTNPGETRAANAL